jgi:hypothetical protein
MMLNNILKKIYFLLLILYSFNCILDEPIIGRCNDFKDSTDFNCSIMINRVNSPFSNSEILLIYDCLEAIKREKECQRESRTGEYIFENNQ